MSRPSSSELRRTKRHQRDSSYVIRRRPAILQLRAESIFLLLLCVVLWAGQSVAAKVSTNSLPTFQVMAIRFSIPILCIPILAAASGLSLKLPKKMIPSVILNGSFLCLQIGLFTAGTDRTTSSHSVVLINSFPFFAALACHLFLPNIQLQPRFLLGFIVAFIGLLVVMSDDVSWLEPANWGGDLLIVAAAATMGLKIALVKSMLARTSPAAMVFWECVLAFPIAAALSLVFESFDRQAYQKPETIIALVYQGLAVSTIAFLAWTRLLKMHDPSQLVVYRLLTPIIGVFLGWLLLKESITLTLLLGTFLVVSGILVVSGRNAPQSQRDNTLTQV